MGTERSRAYKHEQRIQRIMFFKRKIEILITRVNLAPLEVDYSEELERLHKEFPKDRGLILAAEREAYKDSKK
jgi:hypothetical protein